MSARAAARIATRWSRTLRSMLTHDVATRSTSHQSEATLLSAAAMLASGAAVTTAWAAAADPTTPVPGPSPYADASTTGNEGTAQWRIFTDMARDLARQGRQEDAERYLKRALEAAKKGFGETDPHVASACQNLAECYRLQRKYDLAGPLYDQALAILGETYGPRDIRVAFALHNVAGYYFAQKNWDKAAQYYEQALQGKIASVGPGHTETSNTQFHLAEVRWAQGRRKEAIKLAKRSLDAMEQQQASDAACTRRRMRLAEMLMEENNFSEAEPLLKKVLTEAKVEGLGRVPAVEKLARALKELGKYEEAESLLEDAVRRRKEHGGGAGAEHPATAAALRNLAEVRLEQLKQMQLKGVRPAEVAGMQLKVVEAAEESLKIAEKAFSSCVSAQETTAGASSLSKRDSTVGSSEESEDFISSTTSWFQNLVSFGKSASSTEQQALAALARSLKAVRPEVAYLELALSLITQVEVEKVLGTFDVEHLDAKLQRALSLMSSGWPGAAAAAVVAGGADGSAPRDSNNNSSDGAMRTSGFSSKLEEMRHQTICKILQSRFDLFKQLFGAKSLQGAEVAAALTQFNCNRR
jgi:tetratricopeptide (TPR) repeat protein